MLDRLNEWVAAARRLPVLRHPMFSFENGAMTFIVFLIILGWVSFFSVILLG
ncbi:MULTISPECIES: hypothetical protein [Ectothiorhodospira]|uniref:hypothetical protein n=1 Tax=Ectothiorhodospira TaxID=1051 RepID=UPI0012ECAF4A|nr:MULTISPECIES: hypothetical protein [Ectothiorhodospira]MCG5493515.1 hypothetical protein [Ectothiorhodospira variabilis]MCG5496861.1 hypothetical protein [Ectothiorhodospira variabilis]MCG5502844.1 hypothetical protein [Ectothiorhodospira variabilis]MCG5506368.1 hypothetical protein [Ectothiorhodospira variabilis]MCG5523565.1 hypothetical protein [Ectothiorhodospira haloalkaliphila]